MIKITSITILFAVVSTVSVWYTILRIRRDTIGIRSALIWILMWLGIGFFSMFPHLLNPLMRLTQMQNRMFFILIAAVFMLFALVFNLSSKLEKMQRTSSRLIQEMALLRYTIDQSDHPLDADDSAA